MAEVLPTHTPDLFRVAVQRAAELLRAGDIVALPTETVYGLAANALDAKAVSSIFDIKGRPAHNPIIVHVATIELAKRCVAEWPPLADDLARAFWPGPLTLVLPRSRAIPDVVTAGGPTVGVRWPSHPFIQAVIQECRFPLAAPSANPASRLSPTTAEHVRKYFGDRIPLIVDGGQCQVGIESTVLDLSVSPPRLLRPGMIHEQALLAVTGELRLGFGDSEEVLKSPGQLRKHYSPKAKLLICSWTDNEDLRQQVLTHLSRVGARESEQRATPPKPDHVSLITHHASRITHHASLAKTHILAHTQIPSGEHFARVSIIPRDPEAFARALYAELHQCDEGGAELIVVEDLPNSSEWRAVRDRLKRAAAE